MDEGMGKENVVVAVGSISEEEKIAAERKGKDWFHW